MPTQPVSVGDILGIVLAGGRGTRLGALTHQLAKPAVPIGGRGHRLIDFTLSNCLNSGVPQVGVITQYRAESLTPHLEQVWSQVPDRDGRYVTSLPPRDRDGYRGTADAVYRNLAFIRAQAPRYVLVLAGDHVYRMDYRDMLAQHLRSGARISVGCVEVPIADARGFGVMRVDANSHIVDFHEKPDRPAPLPGSPGLALASMGIYLFETPTLLDMLEADARDVGSRHDFGHEVIPRAVREGLAYGHSLRDLHDTRQHGYWRDVGTIDSYFHANVEIHEQGLADDPSWPIRHAPAPVERRTAPGHGVPSWQRLAAA